MFDGSGSVTAILGRDFRDDNFVITVNSLSDFDFDLNVRCDFADVVSCGLVGSLSPSNVFNVDFENEPSGAARPSGWINFVEAGTSPWTVYADGASLGKSVRVRPFRSGDVSTISWLITPQFDLDMTTGEVIKFQTSFDFYDNSNNMQALFSNDWDGTELGISTATWQPLGDAIIADSPADNRDSWPSSGNISLDCLNGIGAVAFKYVGSGDASNDVTYELDNIIYTTD